MDKHQNWKLQSLIRDYLVERGASFVEHKFLIPMLKDSIALTEEEPDRKPEEIVEEVVDYYLDELFAPPEESDLEEADVEEIDKEDLAKVKQPIDDKPKQTGQEEKVVCKICGKEFKVLYPHLIAKHKLTPDQYRKMFPKAQMRAGVPEKGWPKTKKKEKGISPDAGQEETPQELAAALNFRDRLVILSNMIDEIKLRGA